MSAPTLPDELDRLIATVAARVGADPSSSYTAKLLSKGVAHCAKKLGEEAVEAAIAAVAADSEALAAEAADVLYHLVVLLEAAGVPPSAVAQALAARRGVSGLAEKAGRAE